MRSDDTRRARKLIILYLDYFRPHYNFCLPFSPLRVRTTTVTEAMSSAVGLRSGPTVVVLRGSRLYPLSLLPICCSLLRLAPGLIKSRNPFADAVEMTLGPVLLSALFARSSPDNPQAAAARLRRISSVPAKPGTLAVYCCFGVASRAFDLTRHSAALSGLRHSSYKCTICARADSKSGWLAAGISSRRSTIPS